jgi:hypothetical protein
LIEDYASYVFDMIDNKLRKLGYDKLKDNENRCITSRTTRYLPKNERVVLQNTLRGDPDFLKLVKSIFMTNAPQLSKVYDNDPEKLIKFIDIPDWNEPDKTKMDNAVYSNENLVVYGLDLLHPFVLQCARNLNTPIDSPSISGIIISEDGEFPIGYRGGTHFENTGMTVPAGSVVISKETGVDYIFHSFFKELGDELGQTREDIIDAKIIGKIFDPHVGKNSLFVVVGQSKLDRTETLQRWKEKSKDRYEHKRLLFVIKNSTAILKNLSQHDLPYEKGKTPEVPDDELPYLYPLKQSLMTLGMWLNPNFSYQIAYEM